MKELHPNLPIATNRSSLVTIAPPPPVSPHCHNAAPNTAVYRARPSNRIALLLQAADMEGLLRRDGRSFGWNIGELDRHPP